MNLKIIIQIMNLCLIRKRENFSIRPDEDSSIKNKTKLKKNNYLDKGNTVNIIHLRNISQVSSFSDKERERLIVFQLVIIL
jgi:hypothetical protein